MLAQEVMSDKFQARIRRRKKAQVGERKGRETWAKEGKQIQRI